MNKSTAKRLILEQKRKLDIQQNHDVTWVFQTCSIIEAVFGRKSVEYHFISRFSFGILTNDYESQRDIRRRLQDNENKVLKYLDNCIETVDQKGVFKPEQANFVSKLSDTALWTLIPLIGSILFSLGWYLGNLQSDNKNVELRQEIKQIRDSLSITIPSLPNTNPLPDTVTKRQLK